MFRFRQKFISNPSSAIFISERNVLDTGVVEYKKVDYSSKVLPPVENFELDVLLKAGVNLKEVNSKLIPPRQIVLSSEMFDDKKSVEPAETKEN